MVVFTCAHCGDSVHKPKVEKHYETKCRNNFPDLCCVDCLKDFRGDEHKEHTKCVSEAERYGGKGFVAKPSQNKGEKKQNVWIEIVQSVMDENKDLSGPLKHLLEKVSKQPNTPRKESKFINFVKSMDYRANPNDIAKAWSLLSEKLSLVKVNVQQMNGKQEPKENDNKDNEIGNDNKDKNEEVDKPKKNKVKKSEGLDNTTETIEKVEDKDNTKKSKKEKKNKNTEETSTNITLDDSVQLENNVEPKKKSKKNKKDSSEVIEPEIVDQIPAKKSKKQKKSDAAVDDSIIENDIKTNNVAMEVENNSNEIPTTKKNKKNKKNNADNTEISEESSVNDADKSKKRKLPVEDAPKVDVVETKADTETAVAEEKPLSKKERKEKKKREKYEAELEKVSKETKETEMDTTATEPEKKKSKKRKLAAEENAEKPIDTKTEDKADEPKEEPIAKKAKVDDPESFDWVNAITSVLSGKNKEISLKKLEKKVMNEYCGTFNVTSITERINKKFMKSLKHIENVKINNDKVSVCA